MRSGNFVGLSAIILKISFLPSLEVGSGLSFIDDDYTVELHVKAYSLGSSTSTITATLDSLIAYI
ncbi:MAG: hypothetical protein OEZ01_07950 [Candidatus Heimdallarchaeota archaeon]|nr:hypothetical protein [Candidatus Heimdallarchaeota archaeon]MDH5645925.1 hypothetical protein [Candidatus Heimdallarchaeota archaeon]